MARLTPQETRTDRQSCAGAAATRAQTTGALRDAHSGLSPSDRSAGLYRADLISTTRPATRRASAERLGRQR